MMDYRVHLNKSSMFNTPAVYAVYVSMLTLRWLKKNGGIAGVEELNEKKANLLYSEIDINPLFEGYADKADRSNMNATFNLVNDELKETFDTMWKEAGINGLNGHRSVGGYRASMYNALSLESVEVLVDLMSELERKA
jgi:phosphoserine aminotransferase